LLDLNYNRLQDLANTLTSFGARKNRIMSFQADEVFDLLDRLIRFCAW